MQDGAREIYRMNGNEALAKVQSLHRSELVTLKTIIALTITAPHYINFEFGYYVCYNLLIDYELSGTLNYLVNHMVKMVVIVCLHILQYFYVTQNQRKS